MLLRLLLLPVTVPSRIGCKASDAMAASVDGSVRVAQRVAQRLVRRARPPA